jgi:hypothetical protein
MMGGSTKPKHVEQFPDINKLCNVASCWIYWNILTMHVPIKVKSVNNTSKWQMGFNSAFKGLIVLFTMYSKGYEIKAGEIGEVRNI